MNGAKNSPSERKVHVIVQAHQPERRRHYPNAKDCCFGCSCCCCCLHSLGGMVGAAMGNAATDQNQERSGRSVGTVYWIALFTLTVLSVLIWNEHDSILLVLMAMPAIQLAASLVTAVVIAESFGPDASKGLRQVGKMTLWTVLGTAIGVGAMFLVAFLI